LDWLYERVPGYEATIRDNNGHGARVWREKAEEAQKDASISYHWQKKH
jgi:hypothetical protein